MRGTSALIERILDFSGIPKTMTQSKAQAQGAISL
jgi:hypothetical protein